MRADISKIAFPHTRPVSPAERAPGQVTRAGRQTQFDSILKKELAELKFSAHARERMRVRGLELSEQDRLSLCEAVDRAAAKGARDSLILLRNMAFVVSVRNRTVITALDEQSMQNSVFTNIDSAVVMQVQTTE